MKNWQREKLEKLLKKDGKEKAVKALKTVKQNNSERESRGEKRTWALEEIKEAEEVCSKWQ